MCIRDRNQGLAAARLSPSSNYGKLALTRLSKDEKMSIGIAIQTLPTLGAGNYVLACSVSGERLKAIYWVLAFEGGGKKLGQFAQWLDRAKLAPEGEWKRLVYSAAAPAGTEKATMTIEVYGEPDKLGCGMVRDVRLVRQEE